MANQVTISIPTFNQKEFICRALISALKQDYSDIEIDIHDDSNIEDYSDEIAKFSKDKNVNYFKNKNTLGMVSNYRKGLDHATGKYFLNLDGDDELIDESFISKAVNLLEKYPSCVAVIGGQRIIKDSLLIREDTMTDKEYIILSSYEFLLLSLSDKSPVLPHFSTLIRAKNAKKAQYYSKDIVNTDLHSIRNLSLYGEVIFINNICGNWHINDSNQSRDFCPIKFSENISCLTDPYLNALDAFKDKDFTNALKSSYVSGIKKFISDNYSLALRSKDYKKSILNFQNNLTSFLPPEFSDFAKLTKYPRIKRNLFIRNTIGFKLYNSIANLKQRL